MHAIVVPKEKDGALDNIIKGSLADVISRFGCMPLVLCGSGEH